MTPLLDVRGLTKTFTGRGSVCRDVSFTLHPGEVLGIVGESGFGQVHPALLSCRTHRGRCGAKCSFATRSEGLRDLCSLSPSRHVVCSARTDWAFVHQNPRDGLRMRVFGGRQRGRARLHGHRARATTARSGKAPRPGLPASKSHPSAIGRCARHLPRAACSSGCRSRATFVSAPRLVFMDEPTGRPRRERAGAAARPLAQPGARDAAFRGARDPRSCRGAAARPQADGDAGGARWWKAA